MNIDQVATLRRNCARLLQTWRTAAKLTRPELASRLGKKPAFLYRLESGKQHLWVADFIEIVRAVGKEGGQALAEVLSGIIPEVKA